eukprot:XP_028343277.1 uncharacterized protein LOC114485679 [Physeter catodon]
MQRLCDQLMASCFGETYISRVWKENSGGSAYLRRAECARCESTKTDYDMDTCEILREEIISGQLLLEVPQADEGKRFRAALLDSLPLRVREDVWKRAQRRGKATGCPNTSDKGSGGLFPQIKSFQGSELTTQSRSTVTRTSGSSTDGVAVPNNYPCPADLLASLTSIVRRSSAIIALKSALTAGPSRMLAYGLRKLTKRWLPI